MIGPRRMLSLLPRWRSFSRETLRADAKAALAGALVAIPQGIAFAAIAGLPPEYGLYAAMVPTVVAAVFGSSRQLMCGPTTPVSIALFSMLSAHAEPGTAIYVHLALVLTLMVGLMQLTLGLLRFGTFVDFISDTVLIGFTAGAAVLITAGQLGPFLGLDVASHAHAYETLVEAALQLGLTDPIAVMLGGITIAAALASRRFLPGFPDMLVGLAAAGAAAAILEAMPASGAVIDYAPAISGGLPPWSQPLPTVDELRSLVPAAFALTLLALTQSMTIARSLAIRSGQRLDANKEFTAQGLSNIAGAFTSAYVSSGSFNRSALNRQAGARTTLAAALTGALLIAIVPLVAPLVALVPKASLAAVLLLASWGLVDIGRIARVLRASPAESTVMVLTFGSAVIVDLEFAILLGLVASLFLYIIDAARPRIFSLVPDPRRASRPLTTDPDLPDCPQLKTVRIDGSLFFGAVHHVERMFQVFEQRRPSQTHLLLIADGINRIDVSGAELLAEEARRRSERGGGLYLYRPKDQPLELLRRGGYFEAIGEERVFSRKQQAIARITAKLNPEVCERCTVRVFRECSDRPGARPEAGEANLPTAESKSCKS